MISLQRELEAIRPILGDALTDRLVARERREVFSLRPEVRVLAWGGAMLLASAAALVLKNNVERIGPVALALLMGSAAAACYAFVWWRRADRSLVHDSALLLGALLVSADVAFVETQFHLLGAVWHRHFLIVAVLHGIGAYAYGSRMLLSLAISALAAWLGVEWGGVGASAEATELSLRALTVAAAVLAWRAANRREDFTRVFEHFATNFAALGGLCLLGDDATRVVGCLLLLAVAGAIVIWGFHQRAEAFVLYGFVYAVVGIDALLIHLASSEAFTFFLITLSMIGAIVALIGIHARFRELAR